MGKRSDFPRRAQDIYDTPAAAVTPLLPHLPPHTRFIEPCAGAGALMDHLQEAGHICVSASDSAPRAPTIYKRSLFDIRDCHISTVDCFVTNPPWERPLLHAMINHLLTLDLPFWLLIDANWMFTRQAAAYLRFCERIVTIGRVKWIPDTDMTGKDDAAWFRFETLPVARTLFFGKAAHDSVNTKAGTKVAQAETERVD